MDAIKDNPIDFLMGLTKEVTGVLKCVAASIAYQCTKLSSREMENDLPETVSRGERQVKIIGSWLVRLDGEKDLPTELQSVRQPRSSWCLTLLLTLLARCCPRSRRRSRT